MRHTHLFRTALAATVMVTVPAVALAASHEQQPEQVCAYKPQTCNICEWLAEGDAPTTQPPSETIRESVVDCVDYQLFGAKGTTGNTGLLPQEQRRRRSFLGFGSDVNWKISCSAATVANVPTVAEKTSAMSIAFFGQTIGEALSTSMPGKQEQLLCQALFIDACAAKRAACIAGGGADCGTCPD